MASFIQEKWSWVVAVATCFVFAGTMSPLNSFGRLFISLQDDLNLTAVQAGLVGSLAFAGNNLASPVASLTEGLIGYRYCSVLGASMSAILVFASSFTNSYLTFLLCYGILYGIFSNMALHASLCVMYKCFTKPIAQSKAYGLASASLAFGAALSTVSYEKLVPLFGWRGALRISSLYMLLCSVPASFAIYPREKVQRKNEDEKEDTYNTTEEPTIDVGRDTVKGNTPQLVTETTNQLSFSGDQTPESNVVNLTRKDWSAILGDWRAYVVAFAIILPSMSWAVYWMNCISYFESIDQSADDIFLYVSLMTVSDVVGRICFCLFRHKIPLKEVYLLIANDTFYALVTASFVLLPWKPVIIMCSIFIGVGRGWYFINTFPSATSLLRNHHVDCALTLTLVALGTGTSLGTLPAGAIYESTGSYLLAFLLNTVFFVFGAVLLTFLQVHKNFTERTRKD